MKNMKETLECCDNLFKPSESDRLPKLNVMHPCSFLSFLFFLWKTFLMILSQHGFSIGNPFQDLRRLSEGSQELFVQIYRFSFAGLLQNILAESLVIHHIQTRPSNSGCARIVGRARRSASEMLSQLSACIPN